MEEESKVRYGYFVNDIRVFEELPSGGEVVIYLCADGRVDSEWYEDESFNGYEYCHRKGLVSKSTRRRADDFAESTYYWYDVEGRPTEKAVCMDSPLKTVRYETSSYYGSGKKKSDLVCLDFYEFDQWPVLVPIKQTNYFYDHLDRLTQTVVDPNFYSDPNETLIHDGLEIITDYGYDAVGNKTYVIDPNCNIIFTDYDNANRKILEYFATVPSFFAGTSDIDIDTTKSNAVVRRYIQYFNNDKIKSVTSYDYDADVLAVSSFKYDGLGRITETTQMIDDANNVDAVTNIAYYDGGTYVGPSSDPNNLYHIQVTDAEGKDTYIGLSAFGKRARTLYPSGDAERLEYNGDNTLNRKAVWDDNDVQHWIEYSYDEYSKLTGIDYPDTPDFNDIEFVWGDDVYDKRVSKVIDRRYLANADQLDDTEGDVYEFIYDASGNVKSYSYTPFGDPNTWTVDYDYNYLNNQKSRVSVKNPDDLLIYDVYYNFDSVGRLVGVNDFTDNPFASFGYDGNGNRESLVYAVKDTDTVTLSYAYNNDNLLTGFTTTSSGTAYQPAFSFDASLAGDIDGLGRLVSGSETLIGVSGSSVTHDLSYSYDGMGQLLNASVSNIGGSSWSIGYNYGKDGNIKSLTVGGDTVDFEYDSDNDSVDDSDLMTKIGDDSLGWNANGNLNNSVAAAFVYDWDNKLKYAVGGENAVEIRYDPRGNRIYKGVYDTQGKLVKERKYIVDIVGKLPVILCEIDPNDSSLTNKYYYANSQILAQDAYTAAEPNNIEADRYFYLHDRLGSVRQVVDCNALTVATYTFNPYGEDFATEINETIYNPFKYTGQWYDAEIAQYYLRARQYDPKMMRFSGRDPEKGKYKNPLTLHAYLYCRNNSTNYVDPSGRLLGLVTVLFGTSESSAMRAADSRRVMQGAAVATIALTGLYAINSFRNLSVDLATATDGIFDPLWDVAIGIPALVFGASDSSNSEPHGDGGRALEKAGQRIEELEEQLVSASGKEAKKIKKKIERIWKDAQKKKKGETHWN